MKTKVLAEKSDRRFLQEFYVDTSELIKSFFAKLSDFRLTESNTGNSISPVELVKEAARELVDGALVVRSVMAQVQLDNLVDPALAIFLVGYLKDERCGSVFVYQKIGGQWVNKTPSEDRFGFNNCLKVQCHDDLNTVFTVNLGDPIWSSFVLYPDCDLSRACLCLKLLLFEQKGAAITSLVNSKDALTEGHVTRIIRQIEVAVLLIERQLAEWTLREVRRTAS